MQLDLRQVNLLHINPKFLDQSNMMDLDFWVVVKQGKILSYSNINIVIIIINNNNHLYFRRVTYLVIAELP